MDGALHLSQSRGLPIPLTPLIGRERERVAIVSMLEREDMRLLTLTGPGGVGKTRLALQVATDLADAFAGDVFFIPLASIRDPTLVIPTIAQALGLQDLGGRPLAERLIEVLRPQQTLLLLDNLEQVLDAAPYLAELLVACSHLKILATSRSVLHLTGEHDVPVTPLALPPSGSPSSTADVAAAAAVRLFVARAGAARPEFVLTDQNAAAVAAVCQRLDGLPLAIELAATRITHLPPSSLLAKLDQRLPLLTGGPHDLPARLQTMRDAIAWSYSLLPLRDQTLFRTLSLFVGGFTLEAAEVVGDAGDEDGMSILDGVASLVSQSLLHQVEEGGAEPRYAMLETIREYAREQLDASGEAEETRRRHAEFYLEFGEAVAAQLGGAAMAETLTQLATELPNVRAALAWSVESGGDVDAGLRVATALSPFWRFRGHLSEGRRWLEAALAAGPILMTTRIDGLVAAAEVAIFQGEYAAALRLGQEALHLATVHGYPGGEARAWFMLALTKEFQGDLEQALPLHRKAVERIKNVDATHWTSRLVACLADAIYMEGDLNQAETLAMEALALARTAGHAWSEVLALGVLAHVAVDRAEYENALQLGFQHIDVAQTLGARLGIGGALGTLAGVFLATGQPDRATRLLAAGRALGDTIAVVPLVHHLYYERVLTEARHCLDEQAFASAWATGWEMSPEEALADVLAEAEPLRRQTAALTGNEAGLSARELEVLRLLTEGRSDRQIAEALSISPKTAGNHVSSILAKLGVTTRTAAATYAVRHGLA
jgi:predicted ATPase/DNA-binding CsgD family transcriptional regulator